MSDRVDRAERVIPAESRAVYAALVDADALESWLPPQNMTGRIERFDARVGGGFRMTLSHPVEALSDSGTTGPGKTTELDDVVDVMFTELDPGTKVEWQATFESRDPTFAGIMTQTWTLTQVEGNRTHVLIEARGVPDGISAVDHEAGMSASLEQLAAWVTPRPPPGRSN